ncbi:LamG-like jellyroll fold domain-containing protein [Paenibacillus sp. GCM10023252]|uniref:LamG-like jellyroll fold domain-containing protein n=1 Tax=Paenibacillus sp. GCM10023252 TaxID=3252649 RepID=UPI003612C576
MSLTPPVLNELTVRLAEAKVLDADGEVKAIDQAYINLMWALKSAQESVIYTFIPKSSFAIESYSSYDDYEGNMPQYILDGLPSTIWHTKWLQPVPDFPHWIIIDMQETFKLSGIQRMSRLNHNAKEFPKPFELYASDNLADLSDPNYLGDETNRAAGTFGQTWSGSVYRDFAKLNKPVTGRYVKLVINSTYGTAGTFTSMSEVDLTGEAVRPELSGNVSFAFDGNTDSDLSVTEKGTLHYAEGRIGQALQFQSTSEATAPYIDFGQTDQLRFGENQDFSVAFWVKTPGVNADPAIISNKDWASGGNIGWYIGLNGTNFLWNYRTSGSTRQDISIPIGDNVWHHVAITHDRDGYARIYKDGKLTQEKSISNSKGTIDTSYTTKIGVDGKGTLWGNRFDALLDDMHIIGKPLRQMRYKSCIRRRQELVNVTPLEATNKSFTSQSSNPKVADVQNQNGTLITQANETGTTTISVTSEDGSHVAEAILTVENLIDVNADGLLTKEDMELTGKLSGSKLADQRWEEAKKADLNLDGKVNGLDVQIIHAELKKFDKYPLFKHVFVIGLMVQAALSSKPTRRA